jgi:PAS domain S-box-containing protein
MSAAASQPPRPSDDVRAAPELPTGSVLAAIIESSDDAIVSKGLDGIIRTWNKGAERIFGWSSHEVIGKSILTIIPPERHDEEREILARLRAGERIEQFETVRVRKDGRRIDVSLSVLPVRDAAGRVVGASKIARDISERKRAEEMRALLAAIVDNSDDAIVSKSLEGVISSWNRGAERIFGWSAAEAVGQHITLIIPPDRHAEERSILARLRLGERIEHFETVRVRKDGRRLDISLTVSPVRDGGGRIIGASKVARDISERKRADEAQSLLAAIVAGSDDAIISKSLHGVVLSWNAAAERLFGFTAEEMIGHSIAAIIPPEKLDEEREILARLARGERLEHFETVRIRKDGQRLDISLSISPIRDSAGRVIGASKIARDISERRRAEQAVLESTEALERANEELERFVAIASHDLKEPLRGMSMLASLLIEEERELTEAGRQRLDRIRVLCEKLTAMISGLLEYARAGGQRLSEPCDLEKIARGAVDKIADQLQAENAEVEIRGPLAIIEGDPLLLERVFANLIVNGIRHNASERKRVEVGRVGADIYVRDNGLGIDPRHHARVFGLFKRVRGTETDERMGLGLALVHNIVRSHRGRIWLESEPGKGSTFWMRFPAMMRLITPEEEAAAGPPT